MIKIYKNSNFLSALVFSAALLFSILPAQAEEMQVRSIDVAEAFRSLGLDKEVDKKLKKMRNSYTKKLEDRVKKIKDLQSKLERSRGSLSAVDYQREKRRIDMSQKEFQIAQDNANIEMSARQEEETNLLIEKKILRPLQQFSRDNRIDMIIRREVLLYGKSSVDITKDFVSYAKSGK